MLFVIKRSYELEVLQIFPDLVQNIIWESRTNEPNQGGIEGMYNVSIHITYATHSPISSTRVHYTVYPSR